MIEDEAGIGDMRVDQFILPAAVVDVAVVNGAILIDVIVERELRFVERLPVNYDIFRCQPHVVSGAHYSKV